MSAEEYLRPRSSPRRSESPAQQPDQDSTRSDMYSAPQAQSRWERVPVTRQPRDWTYSTQIEKPLPDPPMTREHATSSFGPKRRSQNMLNIANKPRSSPPRRLARPTNLHNLSRQHADASSASNSLHPIAHPYDPLLSSRSAPEDFMRASESDRPDPLLRRRSSEWSQPSPASGQHSRSPIHAYAGARRLRSASGNDAAFADDEEFHLFIDATAGIGPLPSFRSITANDSPSLYDREQYPRSHDVPEPQSSVVSPLGNTPTTMRILRGLAQMPQHSLSPNEPTLPTIARSFGRPARQERSQADVEEDEDEEDVGIDISDSGLGAFIHNSSSPRSSGWLDTNRPMPDDELPSYAMSQAEAHAAQRQAAARRAAELQRRWREGGSKYGAEF